MAGTLAGAMTTRVPTLVRSNKRSAKSIGEAHTAVRCAIARKRASMQSDARPGDPLHKRHLRVLIEVGDVIFVLLQDREDASGRLVGSAAGGDGGLKNRTLRVVDCDLLLAQPDHRQYGLSHFSALGNLVPASNARLACIGVNRK